METKESREDTRNVNAEPVPAVRSQPTADDDEDPDEDDLDDLDGIQSGGLSHHIRSD